MTKSTIQFQCFIRRCIKWWCLILDFYHRQPTSIKWCHSTSSKVECLNKNTHEFSLRRHGQKWWAQEKNDQRNSNARTVNTLDSQIMDNSKVTSELTPASDHSNVKLAQKPSPATKNSPDINEFTLESGHSHVQIVAKSSADEIISRNTWKLIWHKRNTTQFCYPSTRHSCMDSKHSLRLKIKLLCKNSLIRDEINKFII